MATTKSRRHTHKYHAVDTSMGKIWACSLPDCYHHMPSHMRNMLPGKASLCWECGDLFILTEQNMKSDHPICSNCDAGLKAVASTPSLLHSIIGD